MVESGHVRDSSDRSCDEKAGLSKGQCSRQIAEMGWERQSDCWWKSEKPLDDGSAVVIAIIVVFLMFLWGRNAVLQQ